MQASGNPQSLETARFILLMDRFFDCLNGRSLEEEDRKRKPDCKAYRSVDVSDSRHVLSPLFANQEIIA